MTYLNCDCNVLIEIIQTSKWSNLFRMEFLGQIMTVIEPSSLILVVTESFEKFYIIPIIAAVRSTCFYL